MANNIYETINPIDSNYYLKDKVSVVVPKRNINLIADPFVRFTSRDTGINAPIYMENGGHLSPLVGPDPVSYTFTENGWHNTVLTLPAGNTLNYELIYEDYDDFLAFDGHYTFQVIVQARNGPASFNLSSFVNIDGENVISSSGYTIKDDGCPHTVCHHDIGTVNQYLPYTQNIIDNRVGDVNGVIKVFLNVTSGEVQLLFAQVHFGNKKETPIYGWHKVPTDVSESEYGWLGTPYFSPSFRTENTYNGGVYEDLRQHGLSLTNITGLSMPDIELNKQEFGQFGSFLRCVTVPDREITIEGQVHGTSVEDFLCKKADAGKSIITTSPRMFVFEPWIDDCDEYGEPIKFYGNVTNGFVEDHTNYHASDIELDIEMCDVRFYRCIPRVYSLNTNGNESAFTAGTIDSLDSNHNPRRVDFDLSGFSTVPAQTNWVYDGLFQCDNNVIILGHYEDGAGNTNGDQHIFLKRYTGGGNYIGRLPNSDIADICCIGNTLYYTGRGNDTALLGQVSIDNGIFTTLLTDNGNGETLYCNGRYIYIGGEYDYFHPQFPVNNLGKYDTVTGTFTPLIFNGDYIVTTADPNLTYDGGVYVLYTSPTDGRTYIGGDWRVYDDMTTGAPNHRIMLGSVTFDDNGEVTSYRQHDYVRRLVTPEGDFPPGNRINSIVECKGELFVGGDLTEDTWMGDDTTNTSNNIFVLTDRNVDFFDSDGGLQTVVQGNPAYGKLQSLANTVTTGFPFGRITTDFFVDPVYHMCCSDDRLYIASYHLHHYVSSGTPPTPQDEFAILWEYKFNSGNPTAGTFEKAILGGPEGTFNALTIPNDAQSVGIACGDIWDRNRSLVVAFKNHDSTTPEANFVRSRVIRNCRQAIQDVDIIISTNFSALSGGVFNDDTAIIEEFTIDGSVANIDYLLSSTDYTIFRYNQLNVLRNLSTTGNTLNSSAQGNLQIDQTKYYSMKILDDGDSSNLSTSLDTALVIYDSSMDAWDLIKYPKCDYKANL